MADKDKEPKHIHYFALVALVAVVAVLAIIFTSPILSTRNISEENLVGEASKPLRSISPAFISQSSTSNCKLVEFTSQDQTGNEVCSSVNKKCLFSFGSIYYVIKESTDGSCSGATLWMVPEPAHGGMMYQPLDCNKKVIAAELFTIPAFDLKLPSEWGTSYPGTSYCFKGEEGGSLGHDVWVGGYDNTVQQALCCS